MTSMLSPLSKTNIYHLPPSRPPLVSHWLVTSFNLILLYNGPGKDIEVRIRIRNSDLKSLMPSLEA
jgi:hypothetical protein